MTVSVRRVTPLHVVCLLNFNRVATMALMRIKINPKKWKLLIK